MAAATILEEWRQRPVFEFFELSMCFYDCTPNFIEIRLYLFILKLVVDFQHNRGRYLGKWCRTVGDVFFVLSGFFLVSVQNFIKIGT